MDHMPPTVDPPVERPNPFKNFLKKTPDIEALKKKLDLKDAEWDAIAFFKNVVDQSYVFNIIKYVSKDGKINYDMHPHGCGHKFWLISAEGGSIYQQEMTLGDPLFVLLRRYVKGNMEGFLMKRSPEGDDMAANIVKHAQMTIKAFKTLVQGNVAVEV